MYFDSGSILTNIIYSIAPPATARLTAIYVTVIFPTQTPNTDPSPIGNPEARASAKAFVRFIPPARSGIAIDIPSGTS